MTMKSNMSEDHTTCSSLGYMQFTNDFSILFKQFTKEIIEIGYVNIRTHLTFGDQEPLNGYFAK